MEELKGKLYCQHIEWMQTKALINELWNPYQDNVS